MLVAEQQQGAFHYEEEEEKTKVGGETKVGHHSCHSGLVRAEVKRGSDTIVEQTSTPYQATLSGHHVQQENLAFQFL
jgi:hypothetical protein